MMVAKRKIAFHPDHRAGCGGGGYPVLIEPAMPLTPPKTVRRNARERNRVKQIDQGFDKLKSNIPCAAAQKKISRVRILQTAVDYIQHLHAVLNEHESVCSKGPVVKQEPIMSGGASGRGESGGCLSPLAAGMPPTPARSPPKPLLHGGSAAAATAQMMTMPMPYQGYPHHQHLPFPAAGSPYPPPPPLHHYNQHHFHHHHSPMNVHSPISPYASSSAASSVLSPAAFDTSSLASSGYYSHLQGSSPGSLRSSGSREHFFQSPKSSGGHNVSSGLLLSPDGGSGGDFPGGGGCRESLSPSSSSYSDTSLPTPSYQGQQQQQQVPCTQDPTPSTTFHEDDEDILNSIIQWEKY
jgi:hypothetical protein